LTVFLSSVILPRQRLNELIISSNFLESGYLFIFQKCGGANGDQPIHYRNRLQWQKEGWYLSLKLTPLVCRLHSKRLSSGRAG